MTPAQTLCFTEVHRFLAGLFEGDLHAKRVLSLANATLGVIRTASLAVHTIGQGLALARGRMTKHAIPLDVLASGKQVDRLLSNQGIDLDAALRHWVPFVVGPRSCINVAMDWTEFDACGQVALLSNFGPVVLTDFGPPPVPQPRVSLALPGSSEWIGTPEWICSSSSVGSMSLG